MVYNRLVKRIKFKFIENLINCYNLSIDIFLGIAYLNVTEYIWIRI